MEKTMPTTPVSSRNFVRIEEKDEDGSVYFTVKLKANGDEYSLMSFSSFSYSGNLKDATAKAKEAAENVALMVQQTMIAYHQAMRHQERGV